MVDSDLAILYEIPSKRLNEQIRRNIGRFPDDFMFQLIREEYELLRSQFATLETGRGKHRKYMPYVFTEQGVAMLSSVLNSDRAVQVNIAIIRTFVKLREMIETNKDLAKKLDQLERKFHQHDENFKAVFEAIRQLMAIGSPLAPKKIKGLNRK
jgi:3'-phosphoadenosine 5'-phosphosulfate sulfotransferase (PAPS reductase)/FAD synthetase